MYYARHGRLVRCVYYEIDAGLSQVHECIVAEALLEPVLAVLDVQIKEELLDPILEMLYQH